MKNIYKNETLAQVVFPLGGIGSGSIGLAGNGALVDWEIMNRPNRESINSFTNFAIKAEDEKGVIDHRTLQGDISKDFMGSMHVGNQSWGYGHGPNRGTLAGMKHFECVEFIGEYPIATLGFSDKKFPGQVTMEAFNPMIPSNDRDSSIPSAFFSFDVENTTDKPLKYTIALSVSNPFREGGKHYYEQSDHGNVKRITMESRNSNQNHSEFGCLSIGTDHVDVSYQEYLYRGGWFDNLTMFSNDFSEQGKFRNRTYDQNREEGFDTSVLAAHISVEPGEVKTLHFNITWFVPNVWKYWGDTSKEGTTDWKNYYAKLFEDSRAVMDYCFEQWERLYFETKLFKEALFSSDLPDVVMDAIQGNIATLKTSTCLRLTDGEFYAWEGVNKNQGSCEGTCQHVWNYAYVLPFLYPNLERSMRESELKYSLEDTGQLHFRLMLPLGSEMDKFRSCVDGQMGTVMKCYREWKISGEHEWLKKHWKQVKACIDYAWSDENKDFWDPDKTGVIHGRQHHTLDVELFGANSWLTGFYHGALLAGAEMAEAMNESDTAKCYRDLYEKGHGWIESYTFNEKHYIQKIELDNKELLEPFGDEASINMDKGYWDTETQEIKYQIGQGCEIDQVLADWHCDLMGLPQIFDQKHRKKALESIYSLNFKSMRDVDNPCRVFATNGEEGLIMCSWDNGAKVPKIPIPYTQEVMTGFEYAAACNMLQCGMEDEAINIVKAVRDRYDGKKRNPWAEIECGASYSRAMASYSFLLTYSGFKFDMTRHRLGFIPKKKGQYFWSIDGSWGSVELNENDIIFTVLYGKLELKEFIHDLPTVSKVTLDSKMIQFEISNLQDYQLINIDVVMTSGLILKLQ